MTLDFAITCSLVRPGRPRYPVLVHRAAALLHSSFRRHLAMTPLRFANPSPPSGWIEDFHLQAVVHARHTRKTPAGSCQRAHFCILDFPNMSTTFRRQAPTILIGGWNERGTFSTLWSHRRSKRRITRLAPLIRPAKQSAPCTPPPSARPPSRSALRALLRMRGCAA